MIWWQRVQLLWRNQRGLTEVVPWGDLVLLADQLRGGRAEIWMSSLVVVQHITLINHLNASFSGPLAWTAAQNKEIESHLNQGCTAELTWNESYRRHGQWIPIRQKRLSERLKEMGRHWETTSSGPEKYSRSKIHPQTSSLSAHTVKVPNLRYFYNVSHCRFSSYLSFYVFRHLQWLCISHFPKCFFIMNCTYEEYFVTIS